MSETDARPKDLAAALLESLQRLKEERAMTTERVRPANPVTAPGTGGPAEDAQMRAMPDWHLGDRVKVWIGPPKKGYWLRGMVVGIDTGPRPGVQVRAHNGSAGCYATHAEVVADEPVRR